MSISLIFFTEYNRCIDFRFRLNNRALVYQNQLPLMKRACCPVPAFHIFGEVGGTLNINTPGNFTVFPAILPDVLEAMRSVQEEKCTAIMGPPIILRDILHHPQRKEYDLSSLIFGITGAAPVNPAFIEECEREIPIKFLCQAYGQTENTAFMTSAMYITDNSERRYTSVGKPMPRTEVKIADEKGCILPIGEEGEICARGYHVMQGLSFLGECILSVRLYL